MDVFDDLLSIKAFREQSAGNAVTRAKAIVAEREKAVRNAEQAVLKYREFRVAEEARLFQEIRGAKVKLGELEDMKQSVALMRDRELKLDEAIEEAKKAVEPAKQEQRKAEEAHREAQKALQKFEEFVQVQKEEEQTRAAAQEEAEVEEVSEAIFASRARETT